MKLIVGLGKPRPQVRRDAAQRRLRRARRARRTAPAGVGKRRRPTHWWRGGGRTARLLAKPLTFMNLSGHAVGDLLRFFKIDPADMLVVVDDVNLELGRLRARAVGSAGGPQRLEVAHRAAGRRASRGCGSAWGVGKPPRSRGPRAREVRAGGAADRRRGGGPRRGCRRNCSSAKAWPCDEQVQPEGRQAKTRKTRTSHLSFSLSADSSRARATADRFSPEGDT